MVTNYNVPVKYTKYTTAVTTYDTGLTDWENLDAIYRGSTLRNKVVCKLDVALLLTRYFEEETVRKYRDLFVYIAKGLVTDANKFSACIKEFMQMDEKFKVSIQHIYNSCPIDTSFGMHIINVMADVFLNAETNYRSFFRGKPEVVICVSNGYLYFSVDDSSRQPVLIDNIDCEVLSHAKNWNGKFQFIE